MTDLLYRVTELERRMVSMLMLATISEVDYVNSLAEVTAGDFVSGWLPWVVHRAAGDISYWSPEVGEQVLLMSPNGNTEQGVVLPSIYQDKYNAMASSADISRVNFKDGASVEYDRALHHLTIDLPASGADITLTCAGTLNITTDKDTTINADNAVINTAKDTVVNATGNVKVMAGGKATIDAPAIALNGGAPCVTTAHICHLTGLPHGDGSKTVTAGA